MDHRTKNARRSGTLLMLCLVMMTGLQGCSFEGLANFMRALFGQPALPVPQAPVQKPEQTTQGGDTKQNGSLDDGGGLGTSGGGGTSNGVDLRSLCGQTEAERKRFKSVMAFKVGLDAWLAGDLTKLATDADTKKSTKTKKVTAMATKVKALQKRVLDLSYLPQSYAAADQKLETAETACRGTVSSASAQQVTATVQQSLREATPLIDMLLREFTGATTATPWPIECARNASVTEPKDEPSRTNTLIKLLQDECSQDRYQLSLGGIAKDVVALVREIRGIK